VEYPWYSKLEITDNSFEQGDLLKDCPIIIPPASLPNETPEEIDVEVQKYNVVILTQSCDLVNGKISIVQVCPYWKMEDYSFIKNAQVKEKAKKQEQLRMGLIPGIHLLNKCEINGHESDYLIADFRNVYGVDYSFLKEFIKNAAERIRLNPPYREHLSQAFARYFMRVGLPTDIPSFK
jgi:hypothetical protein